MQFQPPYQIDPKANDPYRKLDALNQTINGVGNDWMAIAKNRREADYQKQMLDFQRQKNTREQSEFDADNTGMLPNIDFGGGQPGGGAMQPPAQGPQPQGTLDRTPSFQPGVQGPQPQGTVDWSHGMQGPEPQGTVDYSPSVQPGVQGPQPQGAIDHTAHFNNWMSMGQPANYDHPDYGGRGLALYAQMAKIPGRKGREEFLKIQDEGMKQQQEADKYGTGAGGLYYTPAHAAFALSPDDPARQARLQKSFEQQYPNGQVPKDDVHTTGSGLRLDITQGEKSDQFNKKRLTALGDALDPSKQRGGAFGVSKQVYDRAERLESLASAYADGNLDSRQMEEMAIGLNSMLSGANVGAQQQVKSLVPNTVIGNTQKFVEWLSSNPTGMQQQAFVKRMLGSISREKSTASDQMKRTQFQRIGRYADLEQTNPDEFYNALQSSGVDPNEYRQWKTNGFKPMSAVQNADSSGGGNGGYQQTAVNKQTGQRMGFDGTKWVPIQ